MKHPSLEYLLVACVAAIATFLLTPVARRLAIAWRAVAKPRDRDVHAVATPRMGGVALFGGFALALFVASRLPTLHESFQSEPVMMWVVIPAAIICALGVLDDRYELDSLTKLAGQVLATGLMVTLGGVQMGEIGLPWAGDSTLVLGRDLGIPVTIVFTVIMINALNFIDGLDGLAAGITAIAAAGFFVYSYHLGRDGYTDIVSPATLLAAILAGACLGFLPHNFFPARVFMGDSGSMVLGLLLSAASTTATTSTDPQGYQTALGSLTMFLPLLVLASVLALPFIDFLLAVVRRVSRGRSPFAPDKLHLHHRLLEMGHTHRRAVLLMYFWSALVAFGGVGASFRGSGRLVVIVLSILAGAGVLALVVPGMRRRRQRRRARRDAAPADAGRRPAGGRHASVPSDRNAARPGSVGAQRSR